MAYLALFCRKFPTNSRKKSQRSGRGGSNRLGQIPNFYRKFVLGAPLIRLITWKLVYMWWLSMILSSNKMINDPGYQWSWETDGLGQQPAEPGMARGLKGSICSQTAECTEKYTNTMTQIQIQVDKIHCTGKCKRTQQTLPYSTPSHVGLCKVQQEGDHGVYLPEH